ncbi:hypothetical protein HBI81_069900 [Parastagonospora nodorum]|nr:hypothetical protein HBH51_123010 [Parastagonospora nodorum]KAH6535635.1 hypothetical protein HBI81_069900 [Parastagonospora nodorum]
MLCEQFELVALTAELEVDTSSVALELELLLEAIAPLLPLEAAGWLKLVALKDIAVESPLGASVKDGMVVLLGQIAMPSIIQGRLGVGQTSEGSDGSGAIEDEESEHHEIETVLVARVVVGFEETEERLETGKSGAVVDAFEESTNIEAEGQELQER